MGRVVRQRNRRREADGGLAKINRLRDVEVERRARGNADVERVPFEPLEKALRVKLSSGLQSRGKGAFDPAGAAEIIEARMALASASLSDFTTNPRRPAEPSDSAQDSESLGA